MSQINPTLPLEMAAAGDSGGGEPTVNETVSVLVAHQVAIETASLNDKVTTLTDQLEIAQKALADKAAEFEAFKAEQARLVEVAKRRESRVAEVAKVAPALEATDERADRWAAMEDAEFASYLADLAAIKPATKEGASASGAASFGDKAGETAMSRRTAATTTNAKSAASAVLGL